MRFKIEHVQSGEPACVMARQLDEGEFRVAAGSTLGGAALRPMASQARAAGVYAFWLAPGADVGRFSVGQVVELKST